MKYVDKNKHLKELQQKELEILKYFDKLCKKHNLEYFLAYGTLLGAVRHKGFIPWDDDIDVHMKGEDYLKLIDILKNNFDKKYFFQSIETEKNYYALWNKIRMKNTIFVEKGWENVNINQGIFLDIFPLIEYPDNNKSLKKIDTKIKITKLLIENNIKPNKFTHLYGKSGKILSKIFRLIPQSIRNKIALKNIKYLCNYKSNSGYYFSPDEGLQKKSKKIDFESSTNLKFEDCELKCPIGYDEYLKAIYNDYMTLPKEEDRIGHGEAYLCFNTKDDTDE